MVDMMTKTYNKFPNMFRNGRPIPDDDYEFNMNQQFERLYHMFCENPKRATKLLYKRIEGDQGIKIPDEVKKDLEFCLSFEDKQETISRLNASKHWELSWLSELMAWRGSASEDLNFRKELNEFCKSKGYELTSYQYRKL